MDYWKECIMEACEDAKVGITDEQATTVASWVEGAHDNYGMATGEDQIPNPLHAEVNAWKEKCSAAEKETDGVRGDFRKNVASRNHCSVADVELHPGTGGATIHG